MSHHDVLVVGTGLAGLTAAVRLAQSGARVRVLAKGVGATHLGGGTIDVLGYAPERVDRPGEALAALSASHPYARVGVQRVAAALDWFKAQIGSPATRTPVRSTRTCCCRRRSACPSPPRWRRSRWPAATCAR